MKKKLFCILFFITILLCGCGDRTGSGEEAAQIASFADLDGKTIAVENGSVHAVLIKGDERLSGADISYEMNVQAAIGKLLQSKVDAYAEDYEMARFVVQRQEGLKILEERLDESRYGIAFQKENPLCQEFNEAIAALQSDGTLAEIEDRWTGQDASGKIIPEQNWAGEKGTLVCRVSPEHEPVCYEGAGGELLGSDIEFILRAAERLDYHIIFEKTEFQDLVPSVAAGQCDLAVSAISISEERKQYVDFSDGYMDAGMVLIVRDSTVNTGRAGMIHEMKTGFRKTVLEEERWRGILRGAGTSILITILTVLLGGILGAGMYLWRYSGSRAGEVVVDFLDAFMAFIPASTWIVVVYFIVFSNLQGSNFIAAICALSVSFACRTYDAVSSAIDSLGNGEKEAAISMGYSRFLALRKIFLPHALNDILSLLQGKLVDHIKDTAIVEFISVMDLQAFADLIAAETLEPFFPVALTAFFYIFFGMAGSRLVGRINFRIKPEKTEEEIRNRIRKGIF